jgi:hypothetical protein
VSTVKASLVTFTDFACAIGPDRARITVRLRRQYEDPDSQAYAYYRDFDRAFVEGIKAGDVVARLDQATENCTLRGQSRHFTALASGAAVLLRKVKIRAILPTPATFWTQGDLKLSVSPALGVELADGTREAWFLHHKETVLQQKMADAPLVVLRNALNSQGSDLNPRVIDVRAGKSWGLARNRSAKVLDAFVAEEAEAFVRYWARAAAA